MSNSTLQRRLAVLILVVLIVVISPSVYQFAARATAILLVVFHLAQYNPANWVGMMVGLLSVAILIRGGLEAMTVIPVLQKRQLRPAIAALGSLVFPIVLASSTGILTFVGSILIPQITLQLAFLFSTLMAGLVTTVAIEVKHGWWNRVARGFGLRRLSRSHRVPGQIPWGGLSIKPENEPLHFAILGNTGTGKTTWLEVMMTLILLGVGNVPDTRGIIFDAKRDMIPFLESLGVPYKILNPLDERAVAWDIGNDIRGEGMASEFAALLVEELENGQQ